MAQKAVEINGSAMNLSILAMALDWNEKYEQAIQSALKAVDKDPMLPEAHAYLAEIYADRNNWLRALQESDQALKLQPNNSTVQRNRGYALEMQARYQEAIAAYDKAIELEPQLGYAYIGAGNCYRALNDFGNAIGYYRRAIAANPDSPVGYDALGSTAAMAGDFDLALSSLRRATEIDPMFALGHAHLGKLYYTRYNYEAAIESYKRAIDLGLDKEEHYYGLGLAYANLDMCKEALPWLNKALEVNQQSIPARDGLKACGR